MHTTGVEIGVMLLMLLIKGFGLGKHAHTKLADKGSDGVNERDRARLTDTKKWV